MYKKLFKVAAKFSQAQSAEELFQDINTPTHQSLQPTKKEKYTPPPPETMYRNENGTEQIKLATRLKIKETFFNFNDKAGEIQKAIAAFFKLIQQPSTNQKLNEAVAKAKEIDFTFNIIPIFGYMANYNTQTKQYVVTPGKITLKTPSKLQTKELQYLLYAMTTYVDQYRAKYQTIWSSKLTAAANKKLQEMSQRGITYAYDSFLDAITSNNTLSFNV